jgi:DNA polymerase III subunit delta'
VINGKRSRGVCVAPKTMGFDAFIGNAAAVSALRGMVATNKVPHALLLAGPEGVGKKTLALMFAKALNCQRLHDDFCGECTRCRRGEEMLDAARRDLRARRELKDAARRTEGLIYFDIQLIEPLTRFILIEQVRQLRSVAYTRPFEFARRVFVIDQAHAVHWQATDLLLKVLEEAPDTTTVALVCPNRYELRATLRSRCRLVSFSAVDESTILEVLGRDVGVPESKRGLVARLAGGSVAQAFGFNLEAFQRQREPWLEILSGLLDNSASRGGTPNWRLLFDATRALAENRSDFQEGMRIGYSVLHDLMRVLEGLPDSQVTNIDVIARLRNWAPRLQFSGIVAFKEGLDEIYRLFARNVSLQLGLDALAVELNSLVGRVKTERAFRPLNKRTPQDLG